MTRQSSTLGTQGFIPWKPTLSRQIQWDFWKTKIDTKNAGSSFLGGNPEFLPLVFFLAKTKSFKNTKNPHVWSPPFIFKNSIVNYRGKLKTFDPWNTSLHQVFPSGPLVISRFKNPYVTGFDWKTWWHPLSIPGGPTFHQGPRIFQTPILFSPCAKRHPLRSTKI